jgi:nucleotidyltransferase substrate binding protein (TIGR01987 family)
MHLLGLPNEFKAKVWSCLNEKTKQSIENLERALSRLKNAINTPLSEQSDLLIDGTIQRFDFCIELFWKMLKRALLESGIESGTPREAIQKACQAKWLNG